MEKKISKQGFEGLSEADYPFFYFFVPHFPPLCFQLFLWWKQTFFGDNFSQKITLDGRKVLFPLLFREARKNRTSRRINVKLQSIDFFFSFSIGKTVESSDTQKNFFRFFVFLAKSNFCLCHFTFLSSFLRKRFVCEEKKNFCKEVFFLFVYLFC